MANDDCYEFMLSSDDVSDGHLCDKNHLKMKSVLSALLVASDDRHGIPSPTECKVTECSRFYGIDWDFFNMAHS